VDAIDSQSWLKSAFVPLRRDSPTGAMHAILLSFTTRVLHRHLEALGAPMKTLGEVVTVASGGTPAKEHANYWGEGKGSLSWAAPKDLKSYVLGATAASVTKQAIDEGAVRVHRAPSVLIVTRGMILSRYVPVVLTNRDVAVNQDVRVLTASDPDAIDGRYLAAVVHGAERDMFALVTDSTAGQRRIESQELHSRVRLPILESREQQVELSKWVEAAAAGYQHWKRALSNMPDRVRALRAVLERADGVVSRLFEAERLKGECANVARDFQRTYLRQLFERRLAGKATIEIGDLITRARNQVALDPKVLYSGVGTRMWGDGPYVHEQKLGGEFNAERYAVRRGQLIYNEVWAHNGAIGVLTDELPNPVVSRHFHVFDLDTEKAQASYLRVVFRSPWFWAQCQGGSVGTSGRGHMRRRHLEQIRIPVLSPSEQHELVAEIASLEGHMQQVEQRQRVLDTVLEPLMPAALAVVAGAPGER